jgi:hypothetical protein
MAQLARQRAAVRTHAIRAAAVNEIEAMETAITRLRERQELRGT